MDALKVQLLINSGMAWTLEGAVGRACMAAIDDGACMLGPAPRTDYYGNTVPSRTQVKAGTRGSREFVVKFFGEQHAQDLELLPAEPTLDILAPVLF